MPAYYADLHIHIGTAAGRLVKITASRDLTVERIIQFVPREKGLSILGLVDVSSPAVQADLQGLLAAGRLAEHPRGGLVSEQLLIIPGAELELVLPGRGAAHYLAYFPSLEACTEFSIAIRSYLTNPYLSTQNVALAPEAALELVESYQGFFTPAHAFTPHKGVLGCCVPDLAQAFPSFLPHILTLELGLSADTKMADTVSSLSQLTFLSSSDAHSLPKIGREYMRVNLVELSFEALRAALARESGLNMVEANYGLAPLLGKYHRSFCSACGRIFAVSSAVTTCPDCSTGHFVLGVWDRLQQIADQPSRSPSHRPPYYYQVPLEMLPGIGPKTQKNLIQRVGPEKYILNESQPEELREAVGEKVVQTILRARQGQYELVPGGGGYYGRVKMV